MFCVVNPDYTYAGVPCETFEEALELAAKAAELLTEEEGQKVYIMAYKKPVGTETKS